MRSGSYRAAARIAGRSPWVCAIFCAPKSSRAWPRAISWLSQVKELRPAPSILSRFTGEFIAASVAHETPSDRQLRIKRPDEIVRALEQLDGVVAASGSLVGSAVLSLGAKQYSVELRGIDPPRQKRVTAIAQYLVKGRYGA